MKIVIVGSKIDIMAYTLFGVMGIELVDQTDERKVKKKIEAMKSQIGGILLTSEVVSKFSQLVDSIENLNIPFIELPGNESEAKQSERNLEEVLEKAIGVKISI